MNRKKDEFSRDGGGIGCSGVNRWGRKTTLHFFFLLPFICLCFGWRVLTSFPKIEISNIVNKSDEQTKNRNQLRRGKGPLFHRADFSISLKKSHLLRWSL